MLRWANAAVLAHGSPDADTLSPAALVAMSHAERASKERVEQRQKEAEAAVNERLISTKLDGIVRHDVQCESPFCTSMETMSWSLSSRRFIPKAETWGLKDVDAEVEQYQCLKCGTRFTRSS